MGTTVHQELFSHEDFLNVVNDATDHFRKVMEHRNNIGSIVRHPYSYIEQYVEGGLTLVYNLHISRERLMANRPAFSNAPSSDSDLLASLVFVAKTPRNVHPQSWDQKPVLVF